MEARFSASVLDRSLGSGRDMDKYHRPLAIAPEPDVGFVVRRVRDAAVRMADLLAPAIAEPNGVAVLAEQHAIRIVGAVGEQLAAGAEDGGHGPAHVLDAHRRAVEDDGVGSVGRKITGKIASAIGVVLATDDAAQFCLLIHPALPIA